MLKLTRKPENEGSEAATTDYYHDEKATEHTKDNESSLTNKYADTLV